MAETANVFRGGTGSRLLLLHSGFHTWVEWRRVLGPLTTKRDVIAPTLPGSDGGPRLERGRQMLESLADHAERLLDDAGWSEPLAIAGSSYGGVVALELAARGRASHVIAFAPPWAAPPIGLAWYAALFPPPMAALRVTERLHRWTARPRLFGLIFHGSLRPAAIDSEDAAAIWRSIGRFPLLQVIRETGLRGPGMPDFEAIRSPVTLVWGTRDALAPAWMRDRWLAALHDADLISLPGFPHQPHLRDPGRIAELIIDLTGD
jgi:pimeloyl-ACP methyl ester carboxylesterase